MAVREQTLVVQTVHKLRAKLPSPMLGLDVDNDSAFINETLINYCRQRGLELTRCRAYKKNDQAWIEQKNGAVIRRLVGYGRLEGVQAGAALAKLHEVARLHVNFFQPSFKLKRFCCPRCGLTCTVLPVGMVPYRSSSVKELEDYFDQRLAVEPVTGAVRTPRTLVRALKDLGSRRQRLFDVFGQLISPANATVEQIWRHLRKTIGSLEAILAMLHGKFRTSLFRDYRCLNV